ncbi:MULTISPECIES: glycerophosphodiester phosphodiesterase [unclassified Streptomyces]|uniref:glycerophosphodiester phosphodiesterase n=1 Tax=unclassified Streptomyces TaxID=2593676 RepID=UPI000978FCAF|nr:MULTISPECIES: glycerophosphodiester phosphodiesterase [unclassified Streptomyces]ONI50568.1 Glycerophosphoryl diester phosphodiesterase [Streptomyces sp. IB2014 011-1]RDV49994.1 glycerophosphodiester phosphodiesterase [Streptomyces sp. IB2014 011-12]
MTERVSGTPGRRALLGAAVLSTAALGLAGTAQAQAAERGRGGHGSLRDLPVPTVIGHRGASGYRPEHTLGSYQLALDLGAHIVEQDLVPTKDGHLVCRHENDITATTDVADHPEFAGRKATKKIDGVSYTGWFTEDFTLAELKTLRATERIPGNRPDNTLYDGRWTIPTFEEVLRWADQEGRKRKKPVWLYVETKHPTYFRNLGLGLEEPLARLLRRYGRDRRNAPLILQSFEPSSVQRLARLVDTPRIVLLSGPTTRPWDFVESGDPRTVADLVTPAGLKWIASYAQGIGPTLDLVIPKDAAGRLTTPTTLVKDAHARGLLLHPYTLRNENSFLPADFRRGTDPNGYGDVFGAAAAYFATGIDGLFSDHPDTALLAAADFDGR